MSVHTTCCLQMEKNLNLRSGWLPLLSAYSCTANVHSDSHVCTKMQQVQTHTDVQHAAERGLMTGFLGRRLAGDGDE